jgi:hypothetical protein
LRGIRVARRNLLVTATRTFSIWRRVSAGRQLDNVLRNDMREVMALMLLGAPPEGTPDRAVASIAGRVLEQAKFDRFGHRPVAGIIGVQVIAAVEGRQEPVRAGGITHDRVEVDHRVESA